MNSLGAGDVLLDVVGPLGKPSEVKHYGTVVVIGGGVGAAIAYPTARAMHEAGNHVIAVLCAYLARAVGWLLATAFLLLFFAIIFYFGPDVKVSQWRWLTPGAATPA